MKNVVVVIPTYKKNLEQCEKIALKQVFSVLGEYDIAFVVPEGLSVDYEEVKDRKFLTESFAKEYFFSTQDYSRLCTSLEFYERFSVYEFMLIYQLDAFVFSDKLLEYCNKGYDYYGAPVPHIYWGKLTDSVGNGGFSLRRISKMIEIVRRKAEIDEIINDTLPAYWKKSLLNNEDEYILYGSKVLPDIDLHIPSVKDAFEFSVEYNIGGIYKDLQSHIPFGCHRWATYKFNEWWPIIKDYGYQLDCDYIDRLESEARDRIYNKELLDEKLRSASEEEKSDFAKKIIGDDYISVWGLGKYSQQVISRALFFGLTIRNYYDKSLCNSKNVKYPRPEILLEDQHVIIIASIKYEKEIREEILRVSEQLASRTFTIEEIEEKYIDWLDIDCLGEDMV